MCDAPLFRRNRSNDLVRSRALHRHKFSAGISSEQGRYNRNRCDLFRTVYFGQIQGVL